MSEERHSHIEKSCDDVAVARHVTWVGFWVNAALGVAKIVGGILGRSSALIADGIHSFSDFVSDIIVLAMVGAARRRPDSHHQYGHGRYEALATLLLGVVLIIVAIGLGYDGIERIIAVAHGEELPRPGMVALIILVASIVSKEWLYHYTRRAGERIHSDAVVANAWHHRSDAFSSVATLIGVAGAMFLGPHWRVLDPIAAVVVAVFIVVVGVKLCMPALRELLGASLPEEQQKLVLKAIGHTPGVTACHALRTFKSGNDVFVDIHILVSPDLTVRRAHAIAEAAEEAVAKALPEFHTHVTAHIEPSDDPVEEI